MIGIIAAMNAERVIGAQGTLPWHYPADLLRFKRLTIGATVIMGRRTWESLPKKPLPKRRNIVVTSGALEGVECFPDLPSAVAACEGDVWLIGGEQIFAEGLSLATVVDLTLVPDHVEQADAFFPPLDPAVWASEGPVPHEDDPRLRRQTYHRRVFA